MQERHSHKCDMCLISEVSEFRDDDLCDECGSVVDHGVHDEIANVDYAEYLHDGYEVKDHDF